MPAIMPNRGGFAICIASNPLGHSAMRAVMAGVLIGACGVKDFAQWYWSPLAPQRRALTACLRCIAETMQGARSAGEPTRMNARLKPRNTLLPASVPSTARLLALEDCLRPAPVAKAMRAALISSSTSVASALVAKRFAGTPSAFAMAYGCQRYFLHFTAERRLMESCR